MRLWWCLLICLLQGRSSCSTQLTSSVSLWISSVIFIAISDNSWYFRPRCFAVQRKDVVSRYNGGVENCRLSGFRFLAVPKSSVGWFNPVLPRPAGGRQVVVVELGRERVFGRRCIECTSVTWIVRWPKRYWAMFCDRGRWPARRLLSSEGTRSLTVLTPSPSTTPFSSSTVSFTIVNKNFNPFMPTVAIVGTAIEHSVSDRVKPSFKIFDIRALWRPALSVGVSGCQTLQMTA